MKSFIYAMSSPSSSGSGVDKVRLYSFHVGAEKKRFDAKIPSLMTYRSNSEVRNPESMRGGSKGLLELNKTDPPTMKGAG